MLYIANGDLTVELLDPRGEHPAHGNRYCRGGYIWQVYDAARRPLLSGPEYPHPTPIPFNGQGLPEVFRHEHKQSGRLLTRDESGDGLVIGIGRTSGPGRTVNDVHICSVADWEISQRDDQIRMQTHQAAAGFGCTLIREVCLQDNELVSRNLLLNEGTRTIPLLWYAHPFFAHDASSGTSCLFGFPLELPSNSGFALDENKRLLSMKPEHDWVQGCFQWLEGVAGRALDAWLSHPHLAGIKVTGDFPISVMPVWANPNTLSIEPYLDRTLEPGVEYAWSLKYSFISK